jgi:hypothetical protein
MAKKYKSGTMRITISYGYDIHWIELSQKWFSRIQNGKRLEIKGHGFPTCDGYTQDHWVFNHKEPGWVHIWCDDGRDLYDQQGWLSAQRAI